MVLNPNDSGNSHNWNYSKPENDSYSLSLTGTVVAIQEVQAMEFGADGRPTVGKFWPNSTNPVWNIRMVLVGPKGGFRTWTFTPASKAAKEGKVPSVHLDLFKMAGGVNMYALIGKTITVETDAPPAGFNYGRGNPRPWRVAFAPDGVGPYALTEELDPMYKMERVLANSSASGGSMMTPAATIHGEVMQQALAATGATPVESQPAQPVTQPAPTPPVEDDLPF